jgi:hypothetical protein
MNEPGPPIGELLRQLRDDLVALLRQEIALVKSEMTEKATRIAKSVAFLAIGGAIAYTGAILLLLAASAGLFEGFLAMGLSESVARWLAPLLVGIAIGAVGYALVQKAIGALKGFTPVPRRTVRTLQESRKWLEQKIR